MNVKIPFKERFREAMLDGTKTWTSRTKRYGKKDDVFPAFGCDFLIEKDPFEMMLEEIASFHYKEEGCSSRDEFIAVWRKIHPRKGFVPDQIVWVHQFRRLTEVNESE